MSTKLRSDTALIIGRDALSSVWYLDLAQVPRVVMAACGLAAAVVMAACGDGSVW